MTQLAIIGGSGLAGLPELTVTRREIVRTPYGAPESPLMFGRIGGEEVVFLARNGLYNHVAPDQTNYRANIWALHSVGVRQVVAVSAVWSLTEALSAGGLVLPHDLIDYSRNRADAFDAHDAAAAYLDFRLPYDAALRSRLAAWAQQQDVRIHQQAVYACVSGNRLPTLAEAEKLRRDGADIIGMSGMPEALLARRLDMAYAHVCGIVGHVASADGETGDSRTEAMSAVRSLLAAASALQRFRQPETE